MGRFAGHLHVYEDRGRHGFATDQRTYCRACLFEAEWLITNPAHTVVTPRPPNVLMGSVSQKVSLADHPETTNDRTIKRSRVVLCATIPGTTDPVRSRTHPTPTPVGTLMGG